MTTKPKARKFRIRRTPPTHSGGEGNSTSSNPHDGTERMPQTADAYRSDLQHQTGARTDYQTQDADQPSTDLDAIKREGLTGRQLRMARRVAQKHNLAPTSDFDAVRLLRLQGIDPFQRSNLLELVVPRAGAEQRDGGPGNMLDALRAQRGGAGSEGTKVQLPQTVPTHKQTLPSTGLSPSEKRVKEITEIQRDLARRRRRKLALLLTRLSFFVFLPTFLAGWYFFVIATPMYATKSEFLILQADNTGGGSGLGGLLSGTQFATNQDSIAVQSYLQSKDAMLRLDADAGFKSHFTQPSIDPIQRMNENPSAEEADKT